MKRVEAGGGGAGFFDKEGGAVGGEAGGGVGPIRYVRGNYQPLPGRNVTVEERMHQFTMYIL